VIFGQQPLCVEVCANNAIRLGEVEELKARAREAGREIDKTMLAMSGNLFES
jgi:Fe-S-cluster-containing dehydrogenase component